MADVEKPTPAAVTDEAPAAEAPAADEAPAASSSEQQAAEGEQKEGGAAPTFTYDKSLLIVGKGGRVKRPVRPDNTERDMQVQKLQEEIEKAKTRIGEIKAALDAKVPGTKGGTPEQQEARAKMTSLRNEFQTVLVRFERVGVCVARGARPPSPCFGDLAGVLACGGGWAVGRDERAARRCRSQRAPCR